MTSSFWQVPLHEDFRQHTAFQYRGRSYEFKVVPFGLKTSTAALVRCLGHVLHGIGHHIISFIEDTLITSELHKQHLTHLEEILYGLQNHNLTLNLVKSYFFRKETKFLVLLLTTEGAAGAEKNTEYRQLSTTKKCKAIARIPSTCKFLLKIQ